MTASCEAIVPLASKTGEHMNVVLTESVMGKLGIEFVEVDFRQPVVSVPEPVEVELPLLVPDKVGSGVRTDDSGRWEDVSMYEGQLWSEIAHETEYKGTAWEQRVWESGESAEMLASGPDPYHEVDYRAAFESTDLFYGG